MDDAVAVTGNKLRMSERVAALYDAHIAAAVRFAYLVCGDEPLAQDLAHDAFIRVTGKLGTLRSPEKVGPYLRTAIVNGYRSHLRKVRRERSYLATHTGAGVGSEQPDVATRQEMRRALDLLSPRRRAAVVCRYYEDMTERQTAEVLGCSVPAVKALVARGLETLRTALEGDPE